MIGRRECRSTNQPNIMSLIRHLVRRHSQFTCSKDTRPLESRRRHQEQPSTSSEMTSGRDVPVFALPASWCPDRRGRHRYPRIAALAFAAASVIALFADFSPETTSLTPIMKASWMGLDCG